MPVAKYTEAHTRAHSCARTHTQSRVNQMWPCKDTAPVTD